MAVIYLKHPKHGTKVAISDMEAKADEKHGWMRYNEKIEESVKYVENNNKLKLSKRKNSGE